MSVPSEALAQNAIPTCHQGHEPQNQEFDYFADNILGKLPSNLSGTFYRNGPGRLKLGNKKVGHWFDGDGMLCAFTFKEGKVHFRNKFVRTPKYVKETESGKFEFRGFGTQRPGGILANAFRAPANPANTNSVFHGNKLLALNEGGKPFALDPNTLETEGEFDYDGQLGPMDVFSAHGKIEPKSGHYFNFGSGLDITLTGVKPRISLFAINPAGELHRKGIIPLDSFPFCHDYVITDRYAIYFINSIVMEGIMDVMLGRATIADCISYKKDTPMKIIVVDLNTFEEVQRFETSHGAMIHFGNAWQEGNELVIDGMYADNFEANEGLKDVFKIETFSGGEYRRYRLNLASGKIDHKVMTDTICEFPTFNPLSSGSQHDLTFTACSIPNGHNSFYNGIQTINREGVQSLVTLPPGYYGSEPLFAMANNSDDEKDGYILELLYNAFEHRSELVIFAAIDITQELCRVILPHHIPHQFHGFFTRETFV
ncbi:MAG: all-trans-8'-apo-beta-carotenal 15,15'-oxygenase [Flavobacterium sp.]|jgi:all-trans-8'-apo-beta-carotenal 15,15'-oxygenase